MATKQSTTTAPAQVEVRLLQDSALGRVDDVVLVDAVSAEQLLAAGLADPHPDAVAYARSLRSA
jgi:hypothetical protein